MGKIVTGLRPIGLVAAAFILALLASAGAQAGSPSPLPLPTTTDSRIGIVTGPNHSDAKMNRFQALGSPPVRAEFDIKKDPASLENVFSRFSSRGIRPLVLAGFYNYYPGGAAVDRFCSGIASRYGPGGSSGLSESTAVRYIEFGNESSYQDNTYHAPERYARLFRVCAYAAKRGNPNVGVLAQADHTARVNDWVPRMFAAVPELNQLVTGWTTHPYGPPHRADHRIDRVRDQTAAKGSQAPIFVTEWGLATDNGRSLDDNYSWPTNMTYAQARDAFVSTMTRWKSKYPRMRDVYYYQDRDQRPPGSSNNREHYFGLLRDDKTPKRPLYDTFKQYVARGLR